MARYKRVAPPEYETRTVPMPEQPIVADPMPAEFSEPVEVDTSDFIAAADVGPLVPTHWPYGCLLNVRNTGADYVVTILGEEYDPRHPERAIRFSHQGRLQDFVSRWYARQHHDPRAW